MDQDDRELVRQSRAGDQQAFRELYDRYHRQILAIAAGMTGNPDDAMDVVQETFVRAHRNLGTFLGESSFYTWLYRIAINVSIDLRRRLARRADTTPTRIQVNELVRDVAEIRQRVLRADSIEVRTKMDQGAEAVLGLGQELQQVVINLVTNAEHAVRGRPAAVIQLTTEARDNWVRLTVEDSGPGVPTEIRGRVFDPFFTTKSPDEGSGLGLSICQRVVAEVGGRIWLEDSETLGGAKFVVELPAAPLRGDIIG